MNDSTVSHAEAGPLRLALIQFRPEKADPTENLFRVANLLREQAGSSDLVVFPETALSGYFLEGGVGEAARSVSEVAEGRPLFLAFFRGPW